MDDLEATVRAQLEGWGLKDTAIGAAALDIAVRLDNPRIGATSAAMLHGQLRGYLADLAKLAPDADANDELDELTQARERRRNAAGMA